MRGGSINFASAVAVVGALAAQPAASQTERVLADNWNTAACGFTDTATLVLDAPGFLSRIDIWYRWNGDETAIAYTVLADGAVAGQGTLQRSDCDPYQSAWCIARDTPEMKLPPGRYDFRTANANICQNGGSGGMGFIKAYGR